MAKTEQQSAILLTKSEVLKLLGYSRASGYRYVNYLIENDLISPKYLPGISRPRFLKEEVMSLIDDKQHTGVPVYAPLEGKL